MQINCPACQVPMVFVRTHSHYNIPILLEQCKNCGGIWFDTEELFSVHYESTKDLEPVDSDLLVSDSLLKTEQLVCPRDKVSLRRFTDQILPEKILLESCPSCHGFFVNMSHFSDYLSLRKTKPQPKVFKDKDLEAKLEVLLQYQTDKELYASLEKVGRILAKPAPLRIFLAYWFFGISGYIIAGLSIVLRELWFGLNGSNFRFNTSKVKHDKLNQIIKFIKAS